MKFQILKRKNYSEVDQQTQTGLKVDWWIGSAPADQTVTGSEPRPLLFPSAHRLEDEVDCLEVDW